MIPVLPNISKNAHIKDMNTYKKEYLDSIHDSDNYWSKKARENLTWFRDFTKTKVGNLQHGNIGWFVDGLLNASTNCIDRHIEKYGDKIAIIWESDEPNEGNGRKISYNELLAETCRIANLMNHYGIQKGDIIAIYMPMVPELAFLMLACARIGAPHSIIFAGFSANSLRDRIIDAKSKWIFTTDEGIRGGRILPLKDTVDTAIKNLNFIEKVFMFRRTNNPKISINNTIDIDVNREELNKYRPYCPAEQMNSEDTLFILYTSGSTGTPKGIVHSTAGYLLYTMLTTKYVFDIQQNDILACVADCGWITGHSYIIYGPLANGCTTVMFESTPMYPDCGRYWDLVEKHKITQFYTAPTAIRALMAHDDGYVKKYDRKSLRILGSVGEPINPEAWKWYYEVVGESKCMVVDTYWQTETGGHVGTGLPGATPMKPGACSFPFFGIEFVIKDDQGNDLLGNDVEGRLCIKESWPSIARTVYRDHNRYLSVYMKPFPGVYFTGDGCKRDKDGYYWITGRIDDVLTTSGHRIGTAEIENALVAHNLVAEAAVIGFPHKIKGEGICCFVILLNGIEASKIVEKELIQQVRSVIGAFATPDLMICTPVLPKTRSGKIMRRILRKITCGEESQIGDISTLSEPNVVHEIISLFKTAIQGKDI